MTNTTRTQQTTAELPAYLRRYAADVDRWHLNATQARDIRG